MIKVAVAAGASAFMSVGGWMTALLQSDLEGTAVNTIIPATALTATTGALVWVVRQIIGGTLVHREPAKASEDLTAALSASTEALNASGRREDRLFEILQLGDTSE